MAELSLSTTALAQISQLLDQKLLVLGEKITTEIEKKLQAKIDENSKNIASNLVTIDEHSHDLTELKRAHRLKVEELEETLEKQSNELDDMINRSMRGNIVVKGLPESPNEDWKETKNKLCDHLATLSKEKPQDIFVKIDRAHRSGKRIPGKPRNIYANLVQSCHADYYIHQSIKSNMNTSTNNNIRIDHQYTRKVEDRRNLAKIERRKLLDAKVIAKGHVAYPAKLLVKVNPDQKHWDLQKEF